jgi:hypothetical protein
MPLVEIYQFGGSDGSYAGDCCLIRVDGAPPSWLMIDLGTSTNADDFGKTQFQRAEAVRSRRPAGDLTLVVTHWHADHIGGDRHDEYLRRLKPAVRVATLHAADLGGRPEVLRAESDKNGHLLFDKTTGDYRITIRLIYPDFLAVAKKPKPDENQCSLGALLTVFRGTEPQFSFLTMGDMDPINEEQVIAAVGKTPIDVLKFPHHGSKSNYFPRLFPAILDRRATHVIISGYTNGEPRSLENLFNDGACTVTVLVQNTAKATGFTGWAGFGAMVGRSKGRLRAWKDAAISFDPGARSVSMTGAAWTPPPPGFGRSASLGAETTLDLRAGAPAAGPAGGDGGGVDAWSLWDQVNGELDWQGTNIVAVRYHDSAFLLVPTAAGGECFYRCCARYARDDAEKFADLRRELAASLPEPARTRVGTPGAFADFDDIAAMAQLLGAPIVVHLSEMSDDQRVTRQRVFNDGAPRETMHVLFEYNPADGQGHISTLRQAGRRRRPVAKDGF